MRVTAVRVGALGVALIPLLAILGLLVALAVSGGFGRAAQGANPARPIRPAAPRLEVAGGTDLAATRRRAAQHLAGYSWVEGKPGVAHIPLDRAMAITAERGWRDAGAPP
ncbi:MAG TPA: hypothetical protein VFN88_02700 [Caulobacteraceae bacterium]|nr:hypothetical protein [Caulobacteraceae bacterium]